MAVSRNSLSIDLPDHVGRFLDGRGVAGLRLCVGLSGGCDSVVLVHALSRLKLAVRPFAVHVHHGLSPHADAWAAVCRDYCRKLDIPLAVRHVVVEPHSGLGLEAAARHARYEAFATVDADCLLLAQHRGDQAETVLFNLLRGCGVNGAAAMPAERAFGALRLLRPLLDLPRAEIEAYARSNGLSWVEDESNADTRLSRNYLRHEALTALGERFPGTEAALARAAANFAEAATLLDQLAELDWQASADGDTLQLAGLRALSAPRLKNLLRFHLRRLGWRVPVASRLEEFARQLQAAGPDRHPELILPDGTMHCRRGRLHWRSTK